MAAEFAEESTVTTTDDEGGLGIFHSAEGDVSEGFVVGVFIEFGKLNVTVEEEHATKFGGLVDVYGLEWGGYGHDVLGYGDGHRDLVAADWESQVLH